MYCIFMMVNYVRVGSVGVVHIEILHSTNVSIWIWREEINSRKLKRGFVNWW